MRAREKKSRTFTFVMLWDQVAWVAGCTDYYYVAQGQTPESCIECLQSGLYLTAKWNEMEDRDPWEATNSGPEHVPPEFTDTDSACTYDPNSAGDDHTKTYTGQITVEWEVPTATDKKSWKARGRGW